MSSTPASTDLSPSAQAPAPGTTLATLRVQLDRIDDAVHDLLMQRAEVVAQVGRTKGGVAFRPGREAQIIRRLLGRHRGGLPARVLPRLWRELIAATTSMQGSYVIAVCDTDPANAFVQCAREHFGALTAMRVQRSPAQAIAEVSAGRAIAAVLPMPTEDEAAGAAWWTALLHQDGPRIQVVARLPFWAPRSEGAPQVQALVVAAISPDPSGSDVSLIGLEIDVAVSRARLATILADAGLITRACLLRRSRDADVAHALLEVDGLVADDDPRLAALTGVLRRPVVLGAYATPVIPVAGNGDLT
jgi:chorismate mutase/prephenate dehydratase